MVEWARARLARVFARLGFSGDWFLIPLAAVIGTLGGLVALGFSWMVHTSELFFGGLAERQDVLFPGEEYVMVIVLPAIGGLIVGLITNSRWARGKTGGHGIPDVVEALARRRGVLPRRSGFIKAVTASLTIGSGGSAGVEGPIIHIGSVLGSAVGQALKLGREHMHTLVGCGAAGGLAGIFNAPMAGVLFVLEVVLRDFSLRTFIPIVIASVFGTAISRELMGDSAVFSVPAALQSLEFALSDLGFFIVLGVLCGLVSVLFTRSMILAERIWGRVKLHKVLKPAAGGVMLGLLGVAYLYFLNRPVPDYHPPAFYSNGYRVIEWLFQPQTYAVMSAATDGETVAHATVGLLLVTMFFKLVGTCMTLGSGGSGGILAPSLFMGATLGGALASFLLMMGWMADLQPAAYALAGMAGLLAGVVHCPMTAFLLVFELTGQPKVILPVMLVSILATLIAQAIYSETVYTFYLRRMGIRMGSHSDTTMLRRLEVAHVPLTPAAIVQPDDPCQKLLQLAEDFDVHDYVVCDDKDRYVGMVVGEDLRVALLQREAVPLLIVGELMRTDLPTVRRDQTLDVVLDLFARHDVASLPVVDDAQRVLGMITRSKLLQRYQRALGEPDAALSLGTREV